MAKWTRERIIREILSRDAERLPLNLRKSDRVEPKLYHAASRIFGSWRNAVLAAGLPSGQARSKEAWTPTRILAVIRTLGRRKKPLSAEEVCQRYGHVVPAARRCFGSWAKAVYAAGVDPQKLQRTQKWTAERIIEIILLRAIRNESLERRSVEPRSLVEAGARLFGSWEGALAAAGIDVLATTATDVQSMPVQSLFPEALDETSDESVHKRGTRWSEREILSAVVRRLRAGLDISATAVHRENRGLYRAATRQFGNWRKTLIAAGIPTTKKSPAVKS